MKTLTEIRIRMRAFGLSSDRDSALRASGDSALRASDSISNSLRSALRENYRREVDASFP